MLIGASYFIVELGKAIILTRKKKSPVQLMLSGLFTAAEVCR